MLSNGSAKMSKRKSLRDRSMFSTEKEILSSFVTTKPRNNFVRSNFVWRKNATKRCSERPSTVSKKSSAWRTRSA